MCSGFVFWDLSIRFYRFVWKLGNRGWMVGWIACRCENFHLETILYGSCIIVWNLKNYSQIRISMAFIVDVLPLDRCVSVPSDS